MAKPPRKPTDRPELSTEPFPPPATSNIIAMTPQPKLGKDGSTRTPGPGGGKRTKIGNGMGGAGWGGPAKGAGPDLRTHAAPFTMTRAEIMAAHERRVAAAERLLDEVILPLAFDPEQPAKLRLDAAVRGRDQILGTPIARQINLTVDDMDQLRAEPTDRERAKALALLVQRQKVSGE